MLAPSACAQLLLLLLFLLFGYWLLISLLLASAGEPSHGHMRYDRRLQWFFLYHTLGLLWSAEVILHLGFCVAAGAVVRPALRRLRGLAAASCPRQRSRPSSPPSFQ